MDYEALREHIRFEYEFRRDLSDVVKMSQSDFEAIPLEGFPDDLRDKILGERRAHAEFCRKYEEAEEAARQRRLDKYGTMIGE